MTENHKNNQTNCYNKAIQILSRREHSQLELAQKLQNKGFDKATIATVIGLLIAKNYQSDERFAEEFITMRFNQGKGPQLIIAELSQRGVRNADLSAYDWHASVKSIRETKYGAQIPNKYQKLAKQKRFLQSRGFSFDSINQAFSK